jgi:hypothetical protein
VRIVLVTLTLLVLVALLRGVVRATVVYEFERGLRYVRGKFEGILPPGFYWSVRHLSEIRKVDTRQVFAAITGRRC